jgi:hypothetical protein
MRLNSLCLAGLTSLLTLACASEPEVRPEPRAHHSKGARSGWGEGNVTGDDKGMGMQMSIGFLDERAVDRAMKPHVGALTACFARAGDARQYLSGEVVMRFVVTERGEVSDVQLIKNALGNYSVESCLVLEGKQIQFPAPEGRRGTDFEYAMEFRSTGERSVVPWSGEEMARHMYGISDDLASCGRLGTTEVNVIAYVEPGGTVGSVGFASEGSLDPTAAICAVALMRKLRMADVSAAHTTSVLRATFPMTLAFERPIGETRKLSKRPKHAR